MNGVSVPIFLNSSQLDFQPAFSKFLAQSQKRNEKINFDVTEIISRIRLSGDIALNELTQLYDNFDLKSNGLLFSMEQIDSAISIISEKEKKSLELAASRIFDYHIKQVPEDKLWIDDAGATLGWRWKPISKVGLYVPGGTASYPSSVLMNAIPAKVAGVDEIVITTPTPKGIFNPLVLYAAKLSGVTTIYKIGGAQAVAALAYGTKRIAKVDKITGPGNAYVSAAKKQVFGDVGIDMLAGPSEILIISDGTVDPNWLALDLLSQAEHDSSSQCVLITTNEKHGKLVEMAISQNLKHLKRHKVATESWNSHGAIIIVKNLAEASELSNYVAPEHLQLSVEDPDKLEKLITNAGAIFMGSWTPEAIGDYIGGPNHVLPTNGSARFSSGLSVLDFMKRTSLLKMSPEALRRIGPSAEVLAQSEGLDGHKESISLRLRRLNSS